MLQNQNIRIDKFLWAVRIYKTRSIASNACRKGRVSVNNFTAKPSRLVTKNEIIMVRKLPATFRYRVIEPVEKRIAAKLVPEYVEDITAADEKVKLLINGTELFGYRGKGAGRPTKKERRTIDRLKNDFNNL